MSDKVLLRRALSSRIAFGARSIVKTFPAQLSRRCNVERNLAFGLVDPGLIWRVEPASKTESQPVLVRVEHSYSSMHEAVSTNFNSAAKAKKCWMIDLNGILHLAVALLLFATILQPNLRRVWCNRFA